MSKDLIKELKHLIGRYYPQLQPAFYFVNHRTIRSFFCLKDRPLDLMRSNVIYQYTCSCDQRYIGSTSVNLYVRTAQHQGISHRTGFDLKSPGNSSIRDHYANCNFSFSENNFSIIDSARDAESLRILESICIKKNWNPRWTNVHQLSPSTSYHRHIGICLSDQLLLLQVTM